LATGFEAAGFRRGLDFGVGLAAASVTLGIAVHLLKKRLAAVRDSATDNP